MKYSVYSDGASKGNPGRAGAGYVIYDEKMEIVLEKAIPLGITTNNIAEYTAVLKAAEAVVELKPEHVSFFLDSELIVKQVKGEYKVKDEKLKPLFISLIKILNSINYTIKHVPRNENKVADGLSNIGVDMNDDKL